MVLLLPDGMCINIVDIVFLTKDHEIGNEHRILAFMRPYQENYRSLAASCQAPCTGDKRYSITVLVPSRISALTCIPACN